ncbi:MAG: hypothetical protein MUE52_14305 [Tabrizicola sp.]|jgi:hypothetical protein|nr:hypothetical protein [Tabrizicola sp.]
MTTSAKHLLLATALALGGLVWAFWPPRSADDCAPSDHDCLRLVAEYLIAESLDENRTYSVAAQIRAAGRLLATEGTIDLATQHNRLTAMGFSYPPAVLEAYFNALTDPSYPFDIPATIAAETGPEGTDLEAYLTAAFRLALRDPDQQAKALALWDEHFDALADDLNPSGSTSHFLLTWLSRHDPELASAYFQRAADARAFISGPGGWTVFFRTAAFHCREGRIAEGRRLLDGLQAYFPSSSHIALHVPALLDCTGEDATFAAIEAALGQKAIWAAKVLTDAPENADYIARTFDDLSDDLRRALADWYLARGRAVALPALWSRYGAVEIARRHLPQVDWLAARLKDNQATPVPEAVYPELGSEVVDVRLAFWATEAGWRILPDDDDYPSPYQDIAEDWPSPTAQAAAKGFLQHSQDAPRVVAFIVGLERGYGCALSEARLTALLEELSALQDPLDQARAIIDLIRFTPGTGQAAVPGTHDCLVR